MHLVLTQHFILPINNGKNNFFEYPNKFSAIIDKLYFPNDSINMIEEEHVSSTIISISCKLYSTIALHILQ